MRTRRLFGAGLWLATTAAATALVWAATSVVAADVTDRPAPVVAHRDVVSALAAPPANQQAPPAPASAKAPPSTPPATPVAGPTISSPARSTPTSNPPPSVPFVPFFVPTTVKPATPTSPTTRPTGPSTTVGPQLTATYSTDGGVVTVGCTGPNTIRLVSATPADGYFVFLVSAGPQYVGLQFRSVNNSVTVGASCVLGQPFRFDNGGQPPPTG